MILSTEIHHHLNDRISLATSKSWCQMIHYFGSIRLLSARPALWIVRTLKRIYKKSEIVYIENRRYHLENARVSFCNKCQTNIKNRFRTQTLSKDDRKLSLSDDQKIKRKQFTNWFRTNFRRRRHLKNSAF